MPMQVRVICCGVTPADRQASATALSRARPAASSPTFLILIVLPTLLPRTRELSPTTHSVLVPPPSIPRKKLTHLVLSRELTAFPETSNLSKRPVRIPSLDPNRRKILI